VWNTPQEACEETGVRAAVRRVPDTEATTIFFFSSSFSACVALLGATVHRQHHHTPVFFFSSASGFHCCVLHKRVQQRVLGVPFVLSFSAPSLLIVCCCTF
jgi:hypothetical protein